MTTTATTSSTIRPTTTDHPRHPFSAFDHHQPINLVKNQIGANPDQPSSTNNQHHHLHHSRNSSLASAGSSAAPRPISSGPLSHPPNPITNESLLSSSIDHRHQQPQQASQSTISPLTTIANKLPHLALSQQEPIRRTLESINQASLPSAESTQAALQPQQPPTLRLAHSWTLFFSDTSASKATTIRGGGHYHSHSQRDHTSLLKAAEYQSGMSQVFTGIADVESLCASLAGFKKSISDGIRQGNLSGPPPGITSPNGTLRKVAPTSLIAGHQHPSTGNPDGSPLEDALLVPGNGLGLIAMKPGQNLHFFRVGVNPVWEDPWNSKGGRLTIQTPLTALDPTFESIVLLIAGGVLEADANRKTVANSSHHSKQSRNREGGRVVGVVGSRRLKGDRIEIWLSGPTIGTSPGEDWIRNLQAVLASEIGSPEVRATKYKKHL